MQFATIKTEHGPRAALRNGEHYVDLHATDANLPPSLRRLLESGPEALERAKHAADKPVTVRYPIEEVHFLPPIPDPRKIICIGLNYRDHALEQNAPVPKEPVVFSKFPTTLIAHGDDIKLPKASQEVDYEAELVVV